MMVFSVDRIFIKDVEELERLKHELNGIENKEEVDAARKAMARYKLEGEMPTSFFCKMNKKVDNAAQYDTMIIKEKDDTGVKKEKLINNQKSIEREVRNFY